MVSHELAAVGILGKDVNFIVVFWLTDKCLDYCSSEVYTEVKR